MIERLNDLHWLAIGVGAVASFVFAGVWYGVFGKAWARIYGVTDEQAKAMSANPARTYGSMFACEAFAALGVGGVCALVGVASLADGAAVGAVLALIVGAVGLATHIGAARPPAGFAIDGGKQALGVLLVGAIIGAWS